MKIKIKILIVSFAISAGISHATSGLDRNDPEDVARALLCFGPTAAYHGEWSGIKTNDMWTWGKFIMNSSMEITNLSIESAGIPIPIDKPLKGLPIALGPPLSRFSVSVTAIDDKGLSKSSGSFSADTLEPDSVINITLVPDRIKKFVDYVPPVGVSSNTLSLRLDDGSVYWYDAVRGGFDLWLDSFGDEEWYRIIDGRTGTVLFVGIVGPTLPPSPADSKALNISNMGNVMEAHLYYNEETGGYSISRWFWNQTLDSSVEIGGISRSAKVYITDLEHVEELYGIMIYITDPTADVSVKRWAEDGPLVEVGLLTMEVTPDYRIVYSNERALEKLIITVTSQRINRAFGIGINAICD